MIFMRIFIRIKLLDFCLPVYFYKNFVVFYRAIDFIINHVNLFSFYQGLKEKNHNFIIFNYYA